MGVIIALPVYVFFVGEEIWSEKLSGKQGCA